MLNSLVNAFKNRDVRKKLLFTLGMLIVVRVGSLLPIPGVDTEYMKTLLSGLQTGDTNFLNAFTGGSFEKMSLFALSITPYITSSIIMQLLTIAIPKLEEMQKEGEDGRKKIASITRYVTIGLALIESIAMAIGFGRNGLIKDYQDMSTIHFATPEEVAFVEAVQEYSLLTMLKALKLESYSKYDINDLAQEYAQS